jgi:amicoumacin kinase
MENAVEKVFQIEVLNRFLDVFELEKEFTLLGDFENYVYEVYRGREPFILRVTHSSHRSIDEIYGEIDWVNYLAQHGAHVPTIFPSMNNQLVEEQIAIDETSFYACLFSKVKGVGIRSNDEQFNEILFQSWGREIGKMHRLTEQYKPTLITRKHWYEDDLFEIEKYVPTEKLVIQRKDEMIKQLKELSLSDYGLIHNDVHNGNFFYDQQSIHIFDFDDACYFWYVSDIAIPLYYACYSLFPNEECLEEKLVFANRFIQNFMVGYEKEFVPPENWREQLPLFLKVRDITLYAALNKKIAPEDRDERLLKIMKQIRSRIENGDPIVRV